MSLIIFFAKVVTVSGLMKIQQLGVQHGGRIYSRQIFEQQIRKKEQSVLLQNYKVRIIFPPELPSNVHA